MMQSSSSSSPPSTQSPSPFFPLSPRHHPQHPVIENTTTTLTFIIIITTLSVSALLVLLVRSRRVSINKTLFGVSKTFLQSLVTQTRIHCHPAEHNHIKVCNRNHPARRQALQGQHWDWSARRQYTVTG